jgi:hypothetical protein
MGKKKRRSIVRLDPSPSLHALVFIGISRWGKAVRERGLLFNGLPVADVGPDDRGISDDFRLPFTKDLTEKVVVVQPLWQS